MPFDILITSVVANLNVVPASFTLAGTKNFGTPGRT